MKLHTLSIALAFAFSVASCDKGDARNGDSGNTENTKPAVSKHEELANYIMDSMKDVATTASAVSDLDSAKAAAMKIDNVGDQFVRIAEELKGLDPPDAKVKEAINKKMDERDAEMEKVIGEDLQKTMETLDAESQQVLQKAFGDYFGKMDAVGKEFERHFSVEDESGS